MELINKIIKLLDSDYPNKSQMVNIPEISLKLMQILEVTEPIDKNYLETYLISKGYSFFSYEFSDKSNNIEKIGEIYTSYKPLKEIAVTIVEDVEEKQESDFDLNQFLESEEFLKKVEDVSLFTSYHQNGELFEYLIESPERHEEIVEKLVENNQNLVNKIAIRYQGIAGKSLTHDDLVNEGNLGLLKAIDRFDISRGFHFSTYATHWIRQSITRAIADKSNIIRIPVHMFEKINKMRRIEREFLMTPETEDLYEQLESQEISREQYYKLKTIENNFLHDVSLNQVIGESEDSELMDFINLDSADNILLSHAIIQYFDVERTIDHNALSEELAKVMSDLKGREREVIISRFGLDGGESKTLEEVGKIFGVTRERIRQIEAKALRKLQHPSRSKLLIDFIDS
ncbi:RNA polymerase sigma factor RpoD/SigA [Chryseomicrobium palamuruense]|uniref:RNA polymerase sigma factor RpoD/SigA n=1 Tax=Chryseomicrobium palamuruense TaxID=682973 RepID=A0ABV8UYK4_9BACL